MFSRLKTDPFDIDWAKAELVRGRLGPQSVIASHRIDEERIGNQRVLVESEFSPIGKRSVSNSANAQRLSWPTDSCAVSVAT